MTEKRVYNEKDSELMNKIKQAVSKDDELSKQVKSYNQKDKIIFFAGDDLPQCLFTLWYNGKNNFAITSNDGRQQQRCTFKMDENRPDNSIVEEIKNHLKTARNEFINDINAGNACSNNVKAGKNARQKPTKQQNEPKDETEAEFIEVIRNAMARTDKTALKDQFWKTDVNPWFDDKKKYRKGTYILDEDYSTVESYIGEGGTKIRKEVLPQPYIGDPDAPIWILSMNPSYSVVDVYDMVDCGITAKTKILIDMGYDEQTSKKLLQHNVFPHDGEEYLKFRQGLMQSQLSFSSTEFYVLNPAFNTVPTDHEIQKALTVFASAKTGEAGVQSTNQTYNKGSYKWWKHYLFERNICSPDGVNSDNEQECRNNLSTFFVLESFPYHSENFDSKDTALVSQVLHYEFWKRMVEFALKKGKILLCRGVDIAERVSKIARDKETSNAQIFVFRNGRSLWISTGNFQKYQGQ